MRKLHKNQLIEQVKPLTEANAKIKKLFFAKDGVALNEFLDDCNAKAFEIKSFIEKQGDGDIKTIDLLCEYGEIAEKIKSETDEKVALDLIKQLQKHTSVIENSIKKDVPVNRFEVAFLSYKASMADSLETVYLAAKDDPQCDTYFIAIPYYDKNADGSLGEMRFDDEYPEYMGITDWQEYDFKERRPDVIVFNNPYDNNNAITSVHPDFYVEKLKKFTDLLVYIPYYVCVDDKVLERFVEVPGVAHADKIITQSENVKQEFIKMFKEFERKNNWKGKFGNAYTKFEALGSPKFDKVITAKKENYPLPKEWAEKIGDRKIVLYNTTNEAMLKDIEKYLLKMRSVFEFFKQRKREYDDVILWWRPHPLTEINIKSLRPFTFDEYKSIVSEYILDDFGIYDDTADLHRGIAWSDCYYGDWSSLVALYQFMGKPLMRQNTNIVKYNTNIPKYIAFENLYDDGIHFWFTAKNFNALFKMDKQTWEAEYMGSFPNEKMNGRRLYGQIAENNAKLYFAPCSAVEIGVYEIQTGRFEKVKFDEPIMKNKNGYLTRAKFNFAFLYNQFIFFVGYTYPAIMRYNTANGELNYYTDWVETIDKTASDNWYFLNARIRDNFMVLPVLNTNAVVLFDMDLCGSKIYEVGRKDNKYSSVSFDGENYWLTPRFNGSIVNWNIDTGKYSEYFYFPEGFYFSKGFDSCQESFHFSESFENSIIMFPRLANMALKIDTRNFKISIAEEFQDVCNCDDETISKLNYLMAKKIDGVIYVHTGKTNSFISYNPKTNERREEQISLSLKDKKSILTQILAESNADEHKFETKIKNISYFIDGVCFKNDDEAPKNTDELSGTKIYDFIKSKII